MPHIFLEGKCRIGCRGACPVIRGVMPTGLDIDLSSLVGSLAAVLHETGDQTLGAAVITNGAARGAEKIIVAGTADEMAPSNLLHNPKGAGT